MELPTFNGARINLGLKKHCDCSSLQVIFFFLCISVTYKLRSPWITGEEDGKAGTCQMTFLKGFSIHGFRPENNTEGLNDLLLRVLESQKCITWKNVI